MTSEHSLSTLKEDQMDPSVKIVVVGDKAVGENGTTLSQVPLSAEVDLS